MSEVINLNSDRSHELLYYKSIGFDAEEIAELFEMKISTVNKILNRENDQQPTPPSVA